MQFNGEASNQDMCSFADGLIGTNDTSFPLQKKALYATQAKKIIWNRIWKAYGGWRATDTNNTTTATVSGTLASSVRSIKTPTGLSDLIAVEVTDNNGVKYPLKPITIEQIHALGQTEDDFMSTDGIPEYYRPDEDTIKIYPGASFTGTVRLFFKRGVVTFLPTDTTKTSGLDGDFDEAIPVYMALQQAKAKGKPQAGSRLRNGGLTGLLSDWYDYVGDGVNSDGIIGQAYAKKFREMFPPTIKSKDPTFEYTSQTFPYL